VLALADAFGKGDSNLFEIPLSDASIDGV